MKHEIDEKTLVVFIPAWGAKHLDYLTRFALPSLFHSSNLPKLDLEWVHLIGHTADADHEHLVNILESYKESHGVHLKIEVHGHAHKPTIPIIGLNQCIATSRYLNCRMLLCMPDTVFAQESIYNIMKYAFGKPVCVAAAHLRANEKLIVSSGPRSPAGVETLPFLPSKELVRLVFENPHSTVESSWCDGLNSTPIAGVSLTRISPQMVTAVHSLPTVYLSYFTQSDQRFFEECHSFGSFDHEWPSLLVQGNRLRVAGSSDLFFALELTDPEVNTPGKIPDSEYVEVVNTDMVHHRACQAIIITLRHYE